MYWLCYRLESEMAPPSESTHLESSTGFVEYVGSGKLKDKKALITGGEFVSSYSQDLARERILTFEKALVSAVLWPSWWPGRVRILPSSISHESREMQREQSLLWRLKGVFATWLPVICAKMRHVKGQSMSTLIGMYTTRILYVTLSGPQQSNNRFTLGSNTSTSLLTMLLSNILVKILLKSISTR